jgi:hypothetical protein
MLSRRGARFLFRQKIIGGALEHDRSRQARTSRREKLASSARGHNQLPKVILRVKLNDRIEVVKSQAQAAAA